MKRLRNVKEHLPEVMRPSVRNAIQEAYRSRNVERAKRQLCNLARRLQDEHPGAATSLEALEGGLAEYYREAA
jgi:hypothetical protein